MNHSRQLVAFPGFRVHEAQPLTATEARLLAGAPVPDRNPLALAIQRALRIAP